MVSMRPAIDEALTSACLVTLAGSMMPAFEHVDRLVARLRALKPKLPPFSLTSLSRTEPSRPALMTIWRNGSSSARLTMLTPTLHVALGLDLVDRFDGAQQRDAAAGDDAFLDGRLGGVHGVLDAGLLFLHLGLGGSADLDDGDAADELGEALLELLAVVVGGGVLDLRADLLDAAGDRFLAGLVVGVGDDAWCCPCRSTTFLASPRSSHFTFSSLMPRSSEISLPPVRMAMSSSMALRRSPKPGALTAATLSVPRSLLTTSVARASPSTSSAMMRSGLPWRATCSRIGRRSFIEEIFFS